MEKAHLFIGTLAHASRCGARYDECKHAHCELTKVLLIHMRRREDRGCAMCKSFRSAAKDEHWEGVRRKLSFIDTHCLCSMCDQPVREAARDEHWEGAK
jgi:hypothetical protein